MKLCFLSPLLLLFTNTLIAQKPRLVLPIGHTAMIRYGKFSADAKKVLTRSADNTVKIWDAITGYLLVDITLPDKGYNTMVLSPDSKTMAGGFENDVRIWSTSTGEVSLQLKGHTAAVRFAAFSPDGSKLVTTSIDNTAKVWNTSNGRLISTLHGHEDWIRTAAFSPDNQKIITGSADKTAKIWDAGSGKLLHDLNEHTEYILSAEFSPDGKHALTAANDNLVFVWDVMSGELVQMIKAHSSSLLSAAYAPDGNKILAVYDSLAVMCDPLTAKMIAEYKGHKWSLTDARFSNDGKKVVTCSYDETAKLFDASSGELLQTFFMEKTEGVLHADFSFNDSKLICSTFGQKSFIWNVSSGKKLVTLEGHTSSVYHTAYSPGSKKILVVSSNGSTSVWDADNARPITRLKDKVFSALFSKSEEKIISPFYGSIAYIWDAENGELISVLKNNDTRFTDRVNVSIDGTLLTYNSSRDTIYIWDAAGLKLLGTCSGHTANISSAEFSPDGKKIVSSARDGTVRVWEAHTGKSLLVLKNKTWVTYAEFSLDNKKIVTASLDSTAKIWDAASGQILLALNNPAIPAMAKFSHDGNKVVTGTWEGQVIVWNALTGTKQLIINAHSNEINSSAFSDDGKKIITSADDDGVTKVWNAKTGKLLYSFFVVDSSGYFVQIPTGEYMASKNASKLLHYVTPDSKVISFEQLDVKYNRPDVVLQAIGCTDTSLMKSYRKAYEKRIRKLNIDTTSFKDDYGIPEVIVTNAENIPAESENSTLKLHIKARDYSTSLDRFNILINETPLYGSKGISVRNRNQKYFDTTVSIKLSEGDNRIEAGVLNINGIESYRMPIDVKYISPEVIKQKIFFVGIGIDHFNENQYNLNWSVKDIRDLADNFKLKYGEDCTVKTLFNENVTVDNVMALKQSLMSSNENDKVIIAYSGHGLLTKDFDYFLSTYNVNFHEPEKGGLAYESLEELLDGIPARKKLMLIDACHSGEVDKEELAKMVAVQKKLDPSKKGVVELRDSSETKIGMKNSFELMNELFLNVGRTTGATIISAAAGTQFALEKGDLENGVFSYSILELMKARSTVTISELQQYVNRRVSELTLGMQVPTSRNENKVLDWRIW